MKKVEINNVEYSIGKLDAFKQFHMARRLAPLLESLVPLIDKAKGAAIEDLNPAEFLEPMANVVAKMPEEDANYILYGCLNVVQRKRPAAQDKGWDRVWTPGGGLMFDDIKMSNMLHLVFSVIQENLADFLPGLELPSPNGQKAPTSP